MKKFLFSVLLITNLAACWNTDVQEKPTNVEKKGTSIEITNQLVAIGKSESVEVKVRVSGNSEEFKGSVFTLEAKKLPNGLISTFDKKTLSINAESVLKIESNSQFVPGNYEFEIVVTGNSETKTEKIKLKNPSSVTHLGYAPGKLKETKEIFYKGKSFAYSVLNGVVIYQGDLVLGTEKDVTDTLNAASKSVFLPKGSRCNRGGNDNFLDVYTNCEQWPGGVISYQFAEDWGSPSDNVIMINRIFQAMSKWQLAIGVQFLEARTGPRIIFKNSGGCSSSIGLSRRPFGNNQSVNLSMASCGLSAIVHEIGHALGLYHEQSRSDRDQFVRILRDNIQPGEWHNFNIGGQVVGQYDFQSVMHYGCNDFSKNDSPTLEILNSNVSCSQLGVAVNPSDGDVLALFSLYPPQIKFKDYTPFQEYGRKSLSDFKIEYVNFPGYAPYDRYIKWFDSSNREVGSGSKPRFQIAGNVGQNTYRVDIIVQGILVYSSAVVIIAKNLVPTVGIASPTPENNYCIGEDINFSSSGIDLDGQISTYEWEIIDPQGNRTTETTQNTSQRFFTSGRHQTGVTVKDNDGASATSSTLFFNIVDCDQVPSVRITNPAADLSSIDIGENNDPVRGYYYDVTLQGNATDNQGNPITGSSLVWDGDFNSTINGGVTVLGTGGTLQTRLFIGCSASHYISLTATDNVGRTNKVIRRMYFNISC